jgi:hypothetical protein
MSTSSPRTSSALDALTAAREQVRLELHLLSADARQKWDVIEAKILDLEGKAGDRAQTIADAVATSAMQLSDSVKSFVDDHVRTAKR